MYHFSILYMYFSIDNKEEEEDQNNIVLVLVILIKLDKKKKKIASTPTIPTSNKEINAIHH